MQRMAEPGRHSRPAGLLQQDGPWECRCAFQSTSPVWSPNVLEHCTKSRLLSMVQVVTPLAGPWLAT